MGVINRGEAIYWIELVFGGLWSWQWIVEATNTQELSTAISNPPLRYMYIHIYVTIGYINMLLECWQKSYMDRPSFKTIFTTLTNLNFNLDIVGIDYEQFKSLQLAWKLEIQKTFQEHKKNEAVQ